jgi:exopolyphosphatase / guanosine-5'-triphosphate,3'-diphosphate pyrophosphatase
MTVLIASIDIGSHTARLLVARRGKHSSSLIPVVRKRAYTRLAGDFVRSGGKVIPGPAVERLAEVMDDFLASARECRAEEVYAAATGVFREAENTAEVLGSLRRITGVEIRCLSGQQEALLSSLGVVTALGIKRGPYLVFDLGGATTEMVIEQSKIRRAVSLPLGASSLTGRFLRSDPPKAAQLARLESEIENVLAGPGLRDWCRRGAMVLAGTGGTVTALAAVVQGLDTDDVVPERIDGVQIDSRMVRELLERWKSRSIEERMKFSGLDEGRAEVVLAGAMVVGGIMRRFEAGAVTACMSDLLEGLIIEAGAQNERKRNSLGINI